MRLGRRAATAAVAVCVVAGAGIIIPAGWSVSASTQKYPVPWTFAAAVPAGAQDGPDVPPPGASTISEPCTGSAEHPDPVVLVHGLGGDQNDNWQTIAPFLYDEGYCVYALTYGNDASAPSPFDKFGGLADMSQSAQVLASFVQQVLIASHASKVDLVGHSEGGTMPDWYLKFDGGANYVDHFVALSGVLHGTTFWGLGDLYALSQAYPSYSAQFNQFESQYCQSCEEFLPTSPWMENLDATTITGAAPVCSADGADVLGVQYTSVATNNDELVRPPTSDFLNPACGNTHNILVQQQCLTDQADHISIAADPMVAQDILNALDPAEARPVHCVVVLPAVG